MIPTVAIVTGSRADYGLLRPLMILMREDPALRLQVIVTGMHLDPRFGLTLRAIEEDGFRIDARIAMPLNDDSPLAVANSMGVGLPGLAQALMHLAPQLVVLLGDRYEIFCAAQAAMLLNLPIAHIHGGEASEGAMDEAIRHAITKMSHLHFTAAEPYRARVVQMGEHPSRVWNVGALGLDTIHSMEVMSRAQLEASLHFPLGAHYFLITWHPVTLAQDDPGAPIRELLAALEAFPQYQLLFTGVNADPGHAAITQTIIDHCTRHPGRAFHVQSLGQRRYLSAMRHCAAVIGNSSSGILEAPAMKVPTVNIGSRQQGRLRAPSVLDCEEQRHAIRDALHQVLTPGFTAMVQQALHPFGDGHAAERIMDILKSYRLDNLLMKKFYDLSLSDHPHSMETSP
ncbi:MAG: UDP-N-acetylglucosamine 2-epimerase (hydrolyzing) [Magnetococcales bacterium]|nr:UDP-N-acetylglucosamine 2-epimerase (hydrolyzing) [Magnetococcales bacterium]